MKFWLIIFDDDDRFSQTLDHSDQVLFNTVFISKPDLKRIHQRRINFSSLNLKQSWMHMKKKGSADEE